MAFNGALIAAKLHMVARVEIAEERYDLSPQTREDAERRSDSMWKAATLLVDDIIDLVADDINSDLLDELVAANAQDESGMVNE